MVAASRYGSLDTCDTLVDYGADKSVFNEYGETAHGFFRERYREALNVCGESGNFATEVAAAKEMEDLLLPHGGVCPAIDWKLWPRVDDDSKSEAISADWSEDENDELDDDEVSDVMMAVDRMDVGDYADEVLRSFSELDDALI